MTWRLCCDKMLTHKRATLFHLFSASLSLLAIASEKWQAVVKKVLVGVSLACRQVLFQ